jgi:2-polyprenyl-3-methyl-5-hydroxy-6-metoxy-1,4-benzoquinol methylase
MDVIERLTLEAAQADTMLASEHRHRYEFAAPLVAGARVLDLCCGSGYGSAILAAGAAHVVGVDNDAATIDTARITVARELDNVEFEVADAIAFLATDLPARFDAIVCFEGLEHLAELGRALELLRRAAHDGVRIVASMPNSKMLGEDNPFHVTNLDYEELLALFDDFPEVTVVPQFLAEGSLICPAGATEADVSVDAHDRDEPEYANHLIFCAGFAPEEVQDAHHGRMRLSASPLFNRWSEDLKRGAAALRRENARLGRERLGKAGSAAATALARVEAHDQQLAMWQERCRAAESRIELLEDALTALPENAPATAAAQVARLAHPPLDAREARPEPIDAGGDPNSWEQRRRRATGALIPWIEQTVPLAGKTVLEYGCGNAAVSCAFAERAERVIGVDIDADWIDLGNREIRGRGLSNVELEHHPVQTILDAVAARRGTVDVFLLYAVLEHLTIEERLAVLRLAREVVSPEGAIVVCESPNRLIYFDHHTAQMPFFHLLEPELALRYHHRSGRDVIKQTLDDGLSAGQQAAVEALIRLGRGVSFHEFELVFDDLSRHVIASNYDPLLFGERPVQPDETILWRYLARWRPDLAPVWSRYWLDLVLSPQPQARRAPFLRPWTADTSQSTGVGWTASEQLHLTAPTATLWVTLPQPTRRLVVGSVTPDGHWVVLAARADGSDTSLASAHRAPAGITAYSTFELPHPTARIALQASDECHLVFVGYED